jgi:hypothetical protein
MPATQLEAISVMCGKTLQTVGTQILNLRRVGDPYGAVLSYSEDLPRRDIFLPYKKRIKLKEKPTAGDVKIHVR